MSMLRRRMMAASVKDPDVPTEELDYFTIVMEQDGILYINNSAFSTLEGDFCGSFLYSKNGDDWVEFSNNFRLELKVNIGDNIRVKSYDINRALKQEGSYVEINYANIYSQSAYHVKGSVMSLLYGDDFKNKYSMIGFTLRELFCSFNHEYTNNLTRIETPNTFLPATTISEDCYSLMFADCKNLMNAPMLPANTLAYNCYYSMFYGCENINYIKMLATDISAVDCLADWVEGVASTGTFVKNKDATWDTTPGALGTSGVPAGWTVIDDTFPTNEEGMPESTTFEFPLYFNTEITAETDDCLYRERAMDDILNQYCYFLINSDLDYGENVSDEFFEQYPIFIDGYPVKGAKYSSEQIGDLEEIITTNSYGGYDEIYIGISADRMWVEAYKF